MVGVDRVGQPGLAGAVKGVRIAAAEVVLPCERLAETLEFFVETLGFQVAAIFPADGPRTAVVAGYGLRVRLEQGRGGDPGTLSLRCAELVPAGVVAPNGTRIEFVAAEPPIALPPLRPALVITRPDAAAFAAGRAGMGYRDLVPDRQGGRFIASQIRIERGGPVPDYVHFHRVAFQIIYCKAGWVRVVYEDQGPAFLMLPGDCVVQPPGIRHRVLESSDGLEVIEVTCPAEHETIADPATVLPSREVRTDRAWAGQRFVRHVAEGAAWGPWRVAGFVARDTGIAAATGGAGSVRVVRPSGDAAAETVQHGGELLFLFVLRGAVALRCDGRDERLADGASAAIPAGMEHALADWTGDLELLEVSVPASR